MKRTATDENFLAIPGSSEWELWHFEENRSAKVLNASDCKGLNLPPEILIGIPTTDYFLLALKFSVAQEQALRDMTYLQLEMAGIASRNRDEAVWDLRVAENREGQATVTAIYLAGNSSSLEELHSVSACAPAVEYWKFEVSSVTVWKELNRWNCTVTNQNGVIAVQRLGSGYPDQNMASEILALCLQLEAEKLIDSLEKLIFWDVQPTSAIGQVFHIFKIPVTFESRTNPVVPDVAFDLLETRFREKNVAQIHFRRLLAAGKWVGAIAAVFIVGLVLQTLWMTFEYEHINSGLRKTAEEVGSIQSTVARWKSVSPAVEGDESALETFYRCARHLPPEVRFTLFQYKPTEIVIVGEGENATGIVNLQSQVSSDKDLADYQWRTPPAHILPNNLAHFEITGSKPTYAIIEDK